jgi:hypothetical protein
MRSPLYPVLALAFLGLLAQACGDDAAPTEQLDAGVSTGADSGVVADGGKAEPGEVAFPLRVSRDGRYLEDRAGQPFLINQASSWGLIQSLSMADARAYLDQLANGGWNTVMVSIISYDQRMPGAPPAWQGIDPFTEHWDFSTPNDAYFDHADEVIALARDRGMLVTLVPSYLGFPDDPTQGWADELLSSNNSVDKSRAYGRYLGQRYKSFDNIVWIAGGDNLPARGSELEAHMRAIIEGIRAEAPEQLWTAHWDGKDTGTLSSEADGFASYIDLDGYYAFNYELTYEKDLEQYSRRNGKPLFHLDMSYETEWGGEPAAIRQRAYDAMLSGASGSSFNAGPDWYLFRNFRNMGSQGTRETQHWYQLFSKRPWHQLTPDTDHTAVTAGYGERGSTSYVCVARTSDYRLVMAYLANGGAVTVDLARMPGDTARVSWYDPTSGQTRNVNELRANAQAALTAPSSQSWLLIVESR